MTRRIGWLSLALAAISAVPARADLTLTATGGTVQAGGGTLDIPIYVSSDVRDILGSFTLAFNIEPASNPVAPVSSLEFVSPASYTTDPTLTNPSYVYAGADTSTAPPTPYSFDVASMTTFGAATTDPGGFYTHFVGADSYNGNVPGVRIPGTASLTLATLVVQYSAATVTNPTGDVFEVRLDTTNSSFEDGDGNPTLLAPSMSNNPVLATITVLPQAVPEPATLSLALVAVAAAGGYGLRRRASKASA